MKKIIYNTIGFIFNDYKWYRKWIGGIWYYVRDEECSGFASAVKFWTKKPSDMLVLSTESY